MIRGRIDINDIKRYTFFRCCFTAALNVLWSFIDFMLFGSAFQSLIALKKKDEGSIPLMFETMKVKM
jgi:hypothetical protein